VFVVAFFVALVFWSWTIFLLLRGRIGPRAVIPGGVATAVCVTGLSVFSYLFFSGYLISNYNDYGGLGVVMVVLSYFIGLGVCVHLGAVFGAMWNERHPKALQTVASAPRPDSYDVPTAPPSVAVTGDFIVGGKEFARVDSEEVRSETSGLPHNAGYVVHPGATRWKDQRLIMTRRKHSGPVRVGTKWRHVALASKS
jgi:hypothetical protein